MYTMPGPKIKKIKDNIKSLGEMQNSNFRAEKWEVLI